MGWGSYINASPFYMLIILLNVSAANNIVLPAGRFSVNIIPTQLLTTQLKTYIPIQQK